MPTQIEHDGFKLFPAALCETAQRALVQEVLAAADEAPFFEPVTPGGKPLSVRMTNLGPLGWTTDARGYRYEPRHPVTGRTWPPIPEILTELWERLAGAPAAPDACLVNLYGPDARMGLHQDRDEADFGVPVMSVSLGDIAVFRLGGPKRSDPTRTLRLSSGDVCLLSGPARLWFHGVDRILPGSSRLIPGGGRINLTLRRARPA
jgi:alkylated DNA repair protein (DNA oxidative demethylase)